MSWEEQEPQFNWEGPGRVERLKRLANRVIYFFTRDLAGPYETPVDPELDRPPEVIPEEDKDDWYFPKDWLE